MDARSTLDTAPRRRCINARGGLTFIRVAPRVGVLVMEGRLSDESLPAWEQHFPWLLADDMFLFYDGGNLVRVTARVAATGTLQIAQARKQISEFHVLVSSPVIETMAKNVNTSIGGFMRLHRDRDAFERELLRAISTQSSLERGPGSTV